MSEQSESAEIAVIEYKTAKVYDVGGQVLISGPVQADVAEALRMLVDEDRAELISPPTKIGSSWLAACSHPLRKRIACRLQRDGFTVVVTGPTKEAITVEALDLMQRGARMLEFPIELDGEWTVVLDVVSVDDTSVFNWKTAEYRR